MLGVTKNYDDVFYRDLTICVLNELEGSIKWVNRFSNENRTVEVPFYYSMTGDPQFLLDAFSDDIVSGNSECQGRYVELNTDIIPRGHLTLTGTTIRSSDFKNPNVWVRAYSEEAYLKSNLVKLRAIPISVSYNLTILLTSEIDVFKASQALMDTMWLYQHIYFEYQYMSIDAIIHIPDSNQVTISREVSMSSESNVIKLSLDFEVLTYYPAFVKNITDTTTEPDERFSIAPKRTKWLNNLLKLRDGGTSQNDDSIPPSVDTRNIPPTDDSVRKKGRNN